MSRRRNKGRNEKVTRSGLTGRSWRVKVKTARGRKASSTRWLDRQLNDPYVQEAKKLGYRSRAAFKLLQLNEKYKLLRGGQKVVDLGAAPGGWTQVAVEKVRSDLGSGRVVAVDLCEIEPIGGASTICADIRNFSNKNVIKETLGGSADIVLSDMAAPITGHKSTDHLRTIGLCEVAHGFAVDILTPGGILLMKAFDGGGHKDLMTEIKINFDSVRTAKPDASRSESPETYIIAMGFRGRP